VETRVESDDDSVYVYNEGPQKKVSPFFKLLMGFREGDYFVDEWTTRFSPVYTRYDQWWFEPDTRTKREDYLRIYVFFNPISDNRTELRTFVYVHSRFGASPVIRWIVAPILKRLVDFEVNLDMQMLSQLANKRPDIEGMRLSRFDKVLGLHRKGIDRIYRGEGSRAVVHEAAQAAQIQ
jgi:hypothetical protein